MNALVAIKPEFGQETIGQVLDEIKPLLEKHYAEIAHYQDIPLNPAYLRYLDAENLGILRIFTVRYAEQLVGYAIYFVQPSLHYRDSVQASQDILFLDPEYRQGRLGYKLIRYADQQLAAEGVQVVLQHVKAEHPALRVLVERMGYRLVDHIYAKRLD